LRITVPARNQQENDKHADHERFVFHSKPHIHGLLIQESSNEDAGSCGQLPSLSSAQHFKLTEEQLESQASNGVAQFARMPSDAMTFFFKSETISRYALPKCRESWLHFSKCITTAKCWERCLDLHEIVVAPLILPRAWAACQSPDFFFTSKLPKLFGAASSYTTDLFVGTLYYMGQWAYKPVHASASPQVVSMCLV
jgi:hypothetical protein